MTSFYEDAKELQRSKPHALWQPQDHIRYEKLTGKPYMSDNWMSVYPNPYNKENPKDKYITLDLNEAEDIMRGERLRKENDAKELNEINKNIKYENKPGNSDELKCITCDAYNHSMNVHCWYCSQLMGITKYYSKYGYKQI